MGWTSKCTYALIKDYLQYENPYTKTYLFYTHLEKYKGIKM